MRFLCVTCNEAMKLERVEGPEDGSLSVLFACAACGNRVAMLTNPWETQLVRALDVRIGGRSSPVEPMEFVRSMLASGREAGGGGASPSLPATGPASPSGCPFSAMANLAAETPGAIRQPGHPAIGESDASEPAPDPHPAIGEPRAPSGPVAGVPNSQLAWSPDAERRLERVPEFIRPMIRQSIEHFAAEHGYRLITPEVMAEARGAFGM